MKALEIIQEVYQYYYNKPIDRIEAVKILKELPMEFNLLIAEEEWDKFTYELKGYIPYLGYSTLGKIKLQRKIFSTTVKSLMEQQNISIKDLAREVNISFSVLYEFIENKTPISMHHLQIVLEHFGLALDMCTQAEFTDKYLIMEPVDPPVTEPTDPVSPTDPVQPTDPSPVDPEPVDPTPTDPDPDPIQPVEPEPTQPENGDGGTVELTPDTGNETEQPPTEPETPTDTGTETPVDPEVVVPEAPVTEGQ